MTMVARCSIFVRVATLATPSLSSLMMRSATTTTTPTTTQQQDTTDLPLHLLYQQGRCQRPRHHYVVFPRPTIPFYDVAVMIRLCCFHLLDHLYQTTTVSSWRVTSLSWSSNIEDTDTGGQWVVFVPLCALIFALVCCTVVLC